MIRTLLAAILFASTTYAGAPKWTTSKVEGTPEPPHPYLMARAFPKLVFRDPVHMTQTPSIPRWFVCEQRGPIYSFKKDPNVEKADVFFDATQIKSFDPAIATGVDNVYALAFHPQFAKNRYCYVCYLIRGKVKAGLPEGSRIVRFKVTDTDPPQVDIASEKIVLTWPSGGHNGCDLQFGHDGFLYISTGDGTGPNPPDGKNTGQDVSDLLSSVLRIDVDREDKGLGYAVPPDNPFVKLAGARPEIWAYGFRNPWRMSFDRKTGDLWVGDVGWELWELVYKVQRGGNYGWSAFEGKQPVKPSGLRGPTKILPPTIDFPHTEAASITGGFVYRGKKFPELVGAYVCGDWVTRKVWASKFDGDKLLWHKEIAMGDQRVVGFGEDVDGELYIVHHDEKGTLHELVPNPAAKTFRDVFPRKLSQTGLFANVAEHRLAPGVHAFDVTVPLWADHASAERFVALPGDTPIKMYDDFVTLPERMHPNWIYFPKNGVLGKTLSMEMEVGNPKSRRKLETQMLHYDGSQWHGYTYRWNEKQTDADLVESKGDEIALTVKDPHEPGGVRKQKYHLAGRGECLRCHNSWTGVALAFNLPQLGAQARVFESMGLITVKRRENGVDVPTSVHPKYLVDVADGKQDLEARARSYLHVNCAHCHQYSGGGTADIDLRGSLDLAKMKVLDHPPVQGTFDIPDVRIVAPGDPTRSLIYFRMAKTGPGRMPHIGSEIVDAQGLQVVHDWIRQTPPLTDDFQKILRLRQLDENANLAQKMREAAVKKAKLADRFARDARRVKPSVDDVKSAEAEWSATFESEKRQRSSERSQIVQQLLAHPGKALLLMKEIEQKRLCDTDVKDILKLTQVTTNTSVRDLFERFLPADQRVKRLGSFINAADILDLKGDAERGKTLFFGASGMQCAKCHQIGGTGGLVGPDLDGIGAKMNRYRVLETIIFPSKEIEKEWIAHVVELASGQVITGILASKSEKHVVVRTMDKELKLAADDIASLTPQTASLMPEQLLRDATAQDAADLLLYLMQQKKKKAK